MKLNRRQLKSASSYITMLTDDEAIEQLCGGCGLWNNQVNCCMVGESFMSICRQQFKERMQDTVKQLEKLLDKTKKGRRDG